jgi:hypothetical protein
MLGEAGIDSARRRVHDCERPIRLRGSTTFVNPTTGETRTVYASAQELDGTTWVPCGNRRAAACEPCSRQTHQCRSVPVPRSLVDALAEHVAGRGPDDLVFTTPRGDLDAVADRLDAAAAAARADSLRTEAPKPDVLPLDFSGRDAS